MASCSQGFVAAEIAKLAGTSRDYARRYAAYCWHLGRLLLLGWRTLPTGRTQVYRLLAGQELAAAPQWHRRGEEKEHRLKTCATKSIAAAALEAVCRGCQQRINGFLGEMEQVITAISGDAELLRGLVTTMHRDLAAAAAPEADHEPKNGDQS